MDEHQAWQIDKLNQGLLNLAAYRLLEHDGSYPHHYLLEVRLDNPKRWLIYGGEGIQRRAGLEGNRDDAEHRGDPEWVVLHIEDEDVKCLPLRYMALQGLLEFELISQEQYDVALEKLDGPKSD